MRVLLLFVLYTLLATCLAHDTSYLSTRSAKALHDQVFDLPGAPSSLNFNIYAGYYDVNPATGRHLFYYFVESSRSPSTDPLVLWLNGGPGCSSLEGGFAEHGPLIINPDGKTLRLNPYAWNTQANVVYLESPSGVGFSYSDDPSDYNVGDVRTAQDTLQFLRMFLSDFAWLQGVDFWVSGESYAGHYVPNLSWLIISSNARGDTNINIRGLQVGNAWTQPMADNQGAVQMWYDHHLISLATYNGLMENCDFSNIGPLKAGLHSPQFDPVACNNFQNASGTEMQYVYIYQIYEDTCPGAPPLNAGGRLANSINSITHTRMFPTQPPVSQHKRASSMPKRTPYPYPVTDPCIDEHLMSYMNLPEVQQALHTNITYQWLGCSQIVNYSYTDLLNSMLPVYTNILEYGKITVLVFSGDVDAIVPTTGTRTWIPQLGLPITEAWRPWLDSNQQCGGWTQVWTHSNGNQIRFATVRGAGHMVPQSEPIRSLDLFSRTLNGVSP